MREYPRVGARPAPAEGQAGELLQTIDRKAEAGLCQMTHAGTREFLKDIRKLVAEALAAQQQQGLKVVEPVRNQALPGSREAEMVVLETDDEGNPTIWCDPEIADLVRALNVGGLRTVASCSGHGEKPFGIVTLKDGRELLVLPDFETTRIAERALGVALAAQQQEGRGRE